MNKKALIILLIIIVVIGGVIFYAMQPKVASNTQQSQNQNSAQNQDDTQNTMENTQGQVDTGDTSAVFDIQGMKVEVLTAGTGSPAKTGDLVTVHYTGTLTNGTKFDSSVDRGTPFQFTLGENRVIQGWELGVSGMKVGEKRKLTIPSALAYGDQGAGGVIQPGATLVFTVELLKIN